MAICNNCGQNLRDGAKFCDRCGAPVYMFHHQQKAQRETVFEGKVHKCPNCGENINSFVKNCPACGHEIRNSSAVSSAEQLSRALQQLEAKRPFNNPSKISQILDTREHLQTTDKQIINLIKSFAIPNTKEDVLEFFMLAVSNIDLKVYGFGALNYNYYDPARREISDAWLSKLELAVQKADILFGNADEAIAVRKVYEKKIDEIKKQKQRRAIIILAIILGALSVFFLPIILI